MRATRYIWVTGGLLLCAVACSGNDDGGHHVASGGTGSATADGGSDGSVDSGSGAGGTLGTGGSANSGNGGSSGGSLGTGGSASGGAAPVPIDTVPGVACPTGDPDEGYFCVAGATTSAGSTVRLSVHLLLPAGCEKVSQSGFKFSMSDTGFTFAEDPMPPTACRTLEHCVNAYGATASSCEQQSWGDNPWICMCGAEQCGGANSVWPTECLTVTQSNFYIFAHQSGCQNSYIFEGEVGGILVTVPANQAPGEYVLNVTNVTIGLDNFTEDGCEGALGRGAIVTVTE